MIGLLLTLGALALRTPSTSAHPGQGQPGQPDRDPPRRRRAAGAPQLRAVQAEVDQLQAQALGQDETSLQTRLAALTLASGRRAGDRARASRSCSTTPPAATAPAPTATRAPTRDKDEGKVFSKDLQVVVNGLWEAGAEAISVNGQRLTSRSAIRFAGEAILVNYRPLARPYTISVIGDPEDLQVEFAGNDGGAYARALKDNYGIRVSIDAADEPDPAGGDLAHRARGDACPSPPPHRAPSHRRAATSTILVHLVHVGEFTVIPLLGLIGGVLVGLLWGPDVPVALQPYLPIAVIAALDAVFGAVRAVLDGIFNDKVFVVSFLANVVVAAFIVFLGDQLGVGLAAQHRRRRRPRGADLLQRRLDPQAPVQGMSAATQPAEHRPAADRGSIGSWATAAAHGAAARHPGQRLRGAARDRASGFAIATQVQQTNQSGLEQLREDELVRILDDVSQEQDRLASDTRELETSRDRLLSGVDSSAEALQVRPGAARHPGHPHRHRPGHRARHRHHHQRPGPQGHRRPAARRAAGAARRRRRGRPDRRRAGGGRHLVRRRRRRDRDRRRAGRARPTSSRRSATAPRWPRRWRSPAGCRESVRGDGAQAVRASRPTTVAITALHSLSEPRYARPVPAPSP